METQQQKQDQSAIKNLIFSFSEAFNAADISKTVTCFTPDGINMTNNGPAVQGKENLLKSFEFLFGMAEIHLDYTIDEIIVNGQYAYARTNSKVKTLIKASQEQIFLENKELFILHYDQGAWKISHYMFNNTKTAQ